MSSFSHGAPDQRVSARTHPALRAYSDGEAGTDAYRGPLGFCAMSNDWRTDRIGSAQRGENPTVLRHLDAGFAVIGDTQFLPGYCVLLVDELGVERLSDLPRHKRMAFPSPMTWTDSAKRRSSGRAWANGSGAFRRVNLEILGNTDTFLHAHVWPRFEWEPEELVAGPVWLYPEERWTSPRSSHSEFPARPAPGGRSGSHSDQLPGSRS